MTDCNHHKCVTAFCPLCGESVKASPLIALRQHCERVRVQCALNVDKFVRADWHDDDLAPKRMAEQKWAAYVTALDEVISHDTV